MAGEKKGDQRATECRYYLFGGNSSDCRQLHAEMPWFARVYKREEDYRR